MRSVLLVLLLACGASHQGTRVPADVGSLVSNDAAFASFARSLRAQLDHDLPALTGEPLKDQLFTLSLLDALDNRWPAAVARLDQIAALETSPAAKAMRGLTIRIWADARAGDGDFRAAMERQLAILPVELVRDQLAMLRTMAQVFTPELCRKLVTDEVGPKVRDGRVAFTEANAIAFQRYAVKLLVPVASTIDAVLAAHGIAALPQ
jgi:hypothetical protein